MKMEFLSIKIAANQYDINKLISEKTYNCNSDNSERKLALDIINLQKIMLQKLVNPEMELEINSKCIIEEIDV